MSRRTPACHIAFRRGRAYHHRARGDTVARVRHGETIVIAGLLQAREPIGSVKRRKTDLVILLTPTLMAR